MRLDKNLSNMFFSGGVEYPLKWIDCLVTVSLDPENLNEKAIKEAEVDTIVSGIKNEYIKLKQLISSQIFMIFDAKEIELVINRYHSELVNLLDQVLENQEVVAAQKKAIGTLYNAVISCLDNLLCFIEKRYADYLSLDERVPSTYLEVIKGDLLQKLENLNSKTRNHQRSRPSLKLVMNRLRAFARETHKEFAVTFRTALYKKALVEKLEGLSWEESQSHAFSPLDELLILINYNSKTYIRLLTSEIMDKVNVHETDADRLDQLRFFYKSFNQLQCKPDMIFNPKYHDLTTVLKNWFEQEITYLEERLKLAIEPRPAGSIKHQPKTKEVKTKLVCDLSVDQISLILRAADEARIFVASSLSEVYKSIVPYLATANKSELSPNSVRGKSYNAEDRDKAIAIESLQRMIKKIQGY